ncbi:NAD(FAD)-utilizing dehydrogenases [Limimaricola cinnabarinus LL-001]|uniref:NAD(FAD)-utilizing dehydrogenases n=2 Tax=Limimaricola cinnabarinus TaxID=1125964 RepID=U3AAG5_9RHOB|nr:NAD(FAD)-utilizing dehydrogenases [Limimaricola cinnabarinus LL-001]
MAEKRQVAGMDNTRHINTLILGAGAAGLFAAMHAGGDTLVIDHARAPGEKIRISGGGRCNFTNLRTGPECFVGTNPHFHKSALARYTPWDFLDLVQKYGIAWHEKTLGQLFCDGKATQIVAMLMAEARAAGAEVSLRTSLVEVARDESGFRAVIERAGRRETLRAARVVVATGGKSIPKMGATGLAYRIAEQFGLPLTETRPGLVPLTFPDRFAGLSGVALPVRAQADGPAFDEALLFTHRGLSGPAILQASSYWREGGEIRIDLAPDGRLAEALRGARRTDGKKAVKTVLAQHLPARLIEAWAEEHPMPGNMADQSDRAIDALCAALRDWRLVPSGTEGYRTAEVTLGGVSTDALSSKTMEAKTVPGLHFIGECVDVTGWLGGYNFQWAWASGFAAGSAIAQGG